MSVQFFRLWPRRPPDGSLPLGLSLDDEGLLLAGNCRLIEACLDREGHLFYRARSASELSAILTAAYGEPIDAVPFHPAVERIAELMTERSWSSAKLAALHLRWPELSDSAAATSVLRMDAFLKVTASFDPLKHPRWPKGSDRGGEFRSISDGASEDEEDTSENSEETEEIPLPNGSKVWIHHHHWHDQALTDKLQKRGLLTPEAYKFLKKDLFAMSDEIYQDITDREFRVHMRDAAHIAATADVKQISEQFLKDNHITQERPMTAGDAKLLIQEIRTSELPGIRAYRSLLNEYADGLGSEAEKARAGFIRKMGRENSE
jgi:hypothetical protein